MLQNDLITIIIPVYNEGKNISNAILQTEKVLHYPHNYLVVYDYDDDTSIPYVKKLISKRIPIYLLQNAYKNGVANAVKTGFKNAKGSIIVVMTPDGADDPKVINDMHKMLVKGYDIVCATRYAKGGKRLEKKSIKYLLSNFVGLATPLLLGISTTDVTNGFKMYKQKVIKSIPVESNKGWEFSLEILVKAHRRGYLISEVPAISQPRSLGVSKFKLISWLPLYIKWLVTGIVYHILSISTSRF